MKAYFIAPRILQSFVWRVFAWPLFAYFLRLEVRGYENLKGLKRGMILAPNHACELDPFLIPLSLPLFSRFAPVFYVALSAKAYRNIPTLSWWKHVYTSGDLRLFGAYPFNPGEKNYARALEKHLAIIKDGGSLCIFPEGKRTKNGAVGEGHGGIGYLAYESEAVIIPIAIYGLYRFSRKDFWNRRKKIVVEFCEPVDAQTLRANPAPTAEDFRAFSNSVLSVIAGRVGVQS